MLQFGLRNVLLLRAAVLAIVLDTLSLAARLAAGVLGILATAVDTVLESVFRVIRAGLDTALVAAADREHRDQEHDRRADAVPARRRRRAARLPGRAAHLPAGRSTSPRCFRTILPAIARILDTPADADGDRGARPGRRRSSRRRARRRGRHAGDAAFPDLAALLLPPTAQTELVGQRRRARAARSATEARRQLRRRAGSGRRDRRDGCARRSARSTAAWTRS